MLNIAGIPYVQLFNLNQMHVIKDPDYPSLIGVYTDGINLSVRRILGSQIIRKVCYCFLIPLCKDYDLRYIFRTLCIRRRKPLHYMFEQSNLQPYHKYKGFVN